MLTNDNEEIVSYHNVDFREAVAEFAASDSTIRHRNLQQLTQRFHRMMFHLRGLNLVLKHPISHFIDEQKISNNLRMDYQIRLDYKLLKAISAVFTFQELFKIILEGYRSYPLYSHYEQQEARQLKKDKFEFLKGLRNYITKYEPVVWTAKTNSEGDLILCLDREFLLQGTILRSQSRAFVKSQSELFRLDDILDEYIDAMNNLFYDILNQMNSLDVKDVIESNRLISKVNLALTEGQFESAEEFDQWAESLHSRLKKSIPISSYLLDFRPVYSC